MHADDRDRAREALVAEARELVDRLRQDMRERWQRELPLEELLDDRWDRAKRLGFGDGSSVHQSSHIYGDVTVGGGTWIGPMTVLEGAGGLFIGSHCSISAGVQIYTHDSVRWALSGGVAEYDRAPVRIGDCCHIGANVVILKGVTIGDHCVIGACSLVNRDIPPFSVAFGTPCRRAGSIQVTTSGEITFVMDQRA
jgi:acetyltransferase-like isoleucine patch superfamily enzyme